MNGEMTENTESKYWARTILELMAEEIHKVYPHMISGISFIPKSKTIQIRIGGDLIHKDSYFHPGLCSNIEYLEAVKKVVVRWSAEIYGI